MKPKQVLAGSSAGYLHLNVCMYVCKHLKLGLSLDIEGCKVFKVEVQTHCFLFLPGFEKYG